jgi:hypothetical protein
MEIFMTNAEYHIHIDADFVETSFELFLMEKLYFSVKNFAGFPNENQRHAPQYHLTYKTEDEKIFSTKFKEIKSYLNEHEAAMVGYVEAECVTKKICFEDRPFNPAILMPFKIEKCKLPQGEFREDEIHVTISNRSDDRIMHALEEMGFFSVYIEKDYGKAQVFTAQGSTKNIRVILPLLIDYLNKAGGTVNCVVKEELVRDFIITHVEIVKTPPIIRTVHITDPALAAV